VSKGEQVLVCPDCQRVHDWVADLDRCGSCGSTRLTRTLGVTRCAECGATDDSGGSDVTAAARPDPNELSADVSAALRRVFGTTDP